MMTEDDEGLQVAGLYDDLEVALPYFATDVFSTEQDIVTNPPTATGTATWLQLDKNTGKGNDSTENEEFDLYEGFTESLPTTQREVELLDRCKDLEEQNTEMKLELLDLKERDEDLTRENTVLKEQNQILVKNISVLYKTAVAEIERKDFRLKALQKEYDQLRRNMGSLSSRSSSQSIRKK